MGTKGGFEHTFKFVDNGYAALCTLPKYPNPPKIVIRQTIVKQAEEDEKEQEIGETE